jgi:hypothetical protein
MRNIGRIQFHPNHVVTGICKSNCRVPRTTAKVKDAQFGVPAKTSYRCEMFNELLCAVVGFSTPPNTCLDVKMLDSI